MSPVIKFVMIFHTGTISVFCKEKTIDDLNIIYKKKMTITPIFCSIVSLAKINIRRSLILPTSVLIAP